MKIYLKILAVFLLMVSCQTNKKENNNLSSALENEQTLQNNDVEIAKTGQQFEDFFPKQLGDYKFLEVSESTLLSRTITTAYYLKDNNVKNDMAYSVEDGRKKGTSVLADFEISYKYQNKGEGTTEKIYKERNGYQTIAFLQPDENRNEIWFIYDQRFSIKLEGAEDADKLWSYIKEEDLKKLKNLN